MCNRVLLLFGKLRQWNLHVNCHVNGTRFQSGLRFQTGLSSLRASCKRALRVPDLESYIPPMTHVSSLGSRVTTLGSRVSGLGSHPKDGSRVSGLGSHQKSRVSGPTFRVCLENWKLKSKAENYKKINTFTSIVYIYILKKIFDAFIMIVIIRPPFPCG